MYLCIELKGKYGLADDSSSKTILDMQVFDELEVLCALYLN
jgi:hypothetical protein